MSHHSDRQQRQAEEWWCGAPLLPMVDVALFNVSFTEATVVTTHLLYYIVVVIDADAALLHCYFWCFSCHFLKWELLSLLTALCHSANVDATSFLNLMFAHADCSLHSTTVLPKLMLPQVLGFHFYSCLLWPLFLLTAHAMQLLMLMPLLLSPLVDCCILHLPHVICHGGCYCLLLCTAHVMMPPLITSCCHCH